MIFKDDRVKISFDHLEELGQTYMQVKVCIPLPFQFFILYTSSRLYTFICFVLKIIQGLDRQQVTEVMHALTKEAAYIPKSYIDLYQEKYKKNAVLPPPVPSPLLPSPLPPAASKDMLTSFIGAKL